MIIFKKPLELTEYCKSKQENGASIGFVPTMGALHDGHIRLIQSSKQTNDQTVCSVFVNPTQFNNATDFNTYPITIESDIEKLEAAGCDVLFLPSVDEIYPPQAIKKHFELGYLETILEGKYRPGHFQGVCIVVDIFLSIIPCNQLFLGEKDFQQCMVIRKMMELEKWPIELVIVPTVREIDGLAMSSRNKRLSAAARSQSAVIYKAMLAIKQNLSSVSLTLLKAKAIETIAQEGFEIDYVDITDEALLPVKDWDGKTHLVVLVAASIHNTRLIDNLRLN